MSLSSYLSKPLTNTDRRAFRLALNLTIGLPFLACALIGGAFDLMSRAFHVPVDWWLRRLNAMSAWYENSAPRAGTEGGELPKQTGEL